MLLREHNLTTLKQYCIRGKYNQHYFNNEKGCNSNNKKICLGSRSEFADLYWMCFLEIFGKLVQLLNQKIRSESNQQASTCVVSDPANISMNALISRVLISKFAFYVTVCIIAVIQLELH